MGGSNGKNSEGRSRSPIQQRSPREIATGRLVPDYPPRVIGPVLQSQLLLHQEAKRGRSSTWGYSTKRAPIFGEVLQYNLPFSSAQKKMAGKPTNITQLQDYFSQDTGAVTPVRSGKKQSRNTLTVVVCLGTEHQFKINIPDTDNPIYNSCWLKNEFLRRVSKRKLRYNPDGSSQFIQSSCVSSLSTETTSSTSCYRSQTLHLQD